MVHGATPTRAVLVVPFSPQRIFGVSEGIKDDTVMPLRCADCDANVWYRWNGRAYEPWLHAIGESVRIIAVGMTARDREDPLRHQIADAMCHARRRAGIRNGRRQRGHETELSVGRFEQDCAAVRARMRLIKGGDHRAIRQVRKENSLCYRRLVHAIASVWGKAV